MLKSLADLWYRPSIITLIEHIYENQNYLIININGENLWKLRFADNITFISDFQDDIRVHNEAQEM